MSSQEGKHGEDRDVPPLDRRQLRVTNLSVRNWRNFLKFDVPFQRKMYLVGPNAAGKSNLLDTLRFLAEVVSVGGGFEAAVERRGGVSSLRSLAARQNPAITIAVTVGNESSPREWTYELTFTQDRTKQKRPLITREVVTNRGRVVLNRPDDDDAQDRDRLRQTHLEQVNTNREFRIVADFFSSVRYLHVVPQLVREPERSFGRPGDPFGGDFIQRIATTDKRTRDNRLRRIQRALQLAVPQLQELQLHTDERGIPHLRGNYKHWRPRGAWQDEDRFSDGTIRLLGLLWAIAESSGPLLLEEPELSLHTEVVRQIPQMFAKMQQRSSVQLIVSSHSPDILNDPGIGNDEIVVLQPENEGTSVRLLADFPRAVREREAGVDVAEIIVSMTAPENVNELALFAS